MLKLKIIDQYLFILLVCHGSKISSESTGNAPRILQHPESTIVPKNDPVTLRCDAEGVPEPEITWWKNGLPVTTADHGSHRVLLPSGSLFFLRAVQSRKEQDSGIYWCKASNLHGSVTSNNATLTIAVLREKFRVEPQNINVIKGETAELVCSPPKGNPTPTVFWKKDGKLIDIRKESRVSLKEEGLLVIRDTEESDQGKYQCLAQNIVGTRTSGKAILNVRIKPKIIQRPQNISVTSGEEIHLTCFVEGKPFPEIRWIKRYGLLPPNRVSIRKNSILTIRNTVSTDDGEYVCLAENDAGVAEAVAYVRVHSPPIFLVEPSNQKVAVGAPASLDCIAAGNPTPTLFWTKEGTPEVFLPGTSYNENVFVTPEGTLKIAAVKTEDAGLYSCVAVSESGSSLSRTEVKVQKDSDRPPPIIQLGPVNQTLPIKSKAELPCQVTTSHAKIDWLKDGVPLVEQRNKIHINKDHTLTIKDLSLSDNGLYTCQVRSITGQAVWSAALVVADPNKNSNISFNSMPDFSKFPSSPSKPNLYNATSNSITVVWSKPHRVGGSSLSGYQLDYYTLSSPSHWMTIYNVHAEFCVIDELAPETTIWVLVRALNEHGLSPPSPVSKPLKTQSFNPTSENGSDLWTVRLKLGTRAIELKQVEAVGSRKIKLVWELLIKQDFVNGFHIQVRESSESRYDVITISGGGIRSHTLSDLRPNTGYSIFIVPFYDSIKGKPSNLQIVKTQEDIPKSPPENIKIQLINSSAAMVQWHTPPSRDLHGNLLGYKVLTFVNESQISNWTLGFQVNSFLMTNLTIEPHTTNGARIAAYNKAGIGPFSPLITLLHPLKEGKDSLLPMEGPVIPPGFDLVLQEVWFVSFISVMTLVLILCFTVIICIRRKKEAASTIKTMGHYHVPVHKEMPNFSDREHIWFDPHWKNGSSENHDNDVKTAHLFINKLNNNSDYAEVKGLTNEDGGPYASASIVDEAFDKTASSIGSLSSKRSPNDDKEDKKSNESQTSTNKVALIQHRSTSSNNENSITSSSSDSMSKMPPFPLPPLPSSQHHFSPSLNLFSSPLQGRHNDLSHSRNMRYGNGRIGSFASFGHNYQQGSFNSKFNNYAHSHYSVPGIFYHPESTVQSLTTCCDGGDEQYESASICHYGPVQHAWYYPFKGGRGGTDNHLNNESEFHPTGTLDKEWGSDNAQIIEEIDEEEEEREEENVENAAQYAISKKIHSDMSEENKSGSSTLSSYASKKKGSSSPVVKNDK